MRISHIKGSDRAVDGFRGAWPIYYAYSKLAKSLSHLGTTTTTSLSLSKVHKHLPYQSATESLALLRISNVALMAKEVVLDSRQRVLLDILLLYIIAEEFRKLLVTVSQVNSSRGLLKAANSVSCMSIPGTATHTFGVI